MKFWARFFSLFSCLVLLFAVFSLPALAADNGTIQKVHMYHYSPTAGESGTMTFGQANVVEGETGGVTSNSVYHKTDRDVKATNRLIITNNDGSLLFKSGSKYRIRLENISFGFYWDEEGIEYIFGDDNNEFTSTWSYVLGYNDGTSYRSGELSSDSDMLNVNTQTMYHTFIIDIPSSEKDVERITIYENYTYDLDQYDHDSDHTYIDFFSSFNKPLVVEIEEENKEETLLGGLLEWVKDIGNSVSDTFDTVSSGFANIGTWFAELPTKIWEVMSEGIKGLFVPDEQYMTSYSDKWEELLSDRLGAVYQVCDITLNSWDAIMSADETNTIEFPEVTIPLPDNNSFSFGGYDVKIVPDGFTALAEAVKLAVGILCTYLFVNGLLKRYEEVMGVRE